MFSVSSKSSTHGDCCCLSAANRDWCQIASPLPLSGNHYPAGACSLLGKCIHDYTAPPLPDSWKLYFHCRLDKPCLTLWPPSLSLEAPGAV